MFDHVQIKVADLGACRNFYTELLATLDHRVVLDEDVVVGIGVSLNNMFEISQARESAPLSSSIHVAFSANNKDAVRSFYETAIRLGAKDNGKPDYRPYMDRVILPHSLFVLMDTI